MTTQRTFKRRVRERMAKTGESYTAARRMLLAADPTPDSVPADWKPPVSDAAVEHATGETWTHWLAAIDEWVSGPGAGDHSHRAIVRWLREEHDVAHWWAQSITVGYERARGLRLPGQQPAGFAIGATKTISVAVERLFTAVVDPAERERWLPGAAMTERTSNPNRTARFDWEDGGTLLACYFDDLGPAKSRLALSHEKLPDADTAEAMKMWWRERLNELKASLEAG